MYAARNGNADTVEVLLEAGASTEAKNNVSKRISICTCVCVFVCVCVCVCVLYSCIIVLFYSILLFYSSILLLWYVVYDDFISMSNVFVFVLMIITF